MVNGRPSIVTRLLCALPFGDPVLSAIHPQRLVELHTHIGSSTCGGVVQSNQATVDALGDVDAEVTVLAPTNSGLALEQVDFTDVRPPFCSCKSCVFRSPILTGVPAYTQMCSIRKDRASYLNSGFCPPVSFTPMWTCSLLETGYQYAILSELARTCGWLMCRSLSVREPVEITCKQLCSWRYCVLMSFMWW